MRVMGQFVLCAYVYIFFFFLHSPIFARAKLKWHFLVIGMFQLDLKLMMTRKHRHLKMVTLGMHTSIYIYISITRGFVGLLAIVYLQWTIPCF